MIMHLWCIICPFGTEFKPDKFLNKTTMIPATQINWDAFFIHKVLNVQFHINLRTIVSIYAMHGYG